ncbi:Uncharacterized protein APZ42_029129 [Daphnia magna]|nr:Uncharacterized protein APZ42_029129 [Daphnia magna]
MLEQRGSVWKQQQWLPHAYAAVNVSLTSWSAKDIRPIKTPRSQLSTRIAVQLFYATANQRGVI